MAAKKVEELEKYLEGELVSMRTAMEERFASLEALITKMAETQIRVAMHAGPQPVDQQGNKTNGAGDENHVDGDGSAGGVAAVKGGENRGKGEQRAFAPKAGVNQLGSPSHKGYSGDPVEFFDGRNAGRGPAAPGWSEVEQFPVIPPGTRDYWPSTGPYGGYNAAAHGIGDVGDPAAGYRGPPKPPWAEPGQNGSGLRRFGADSQIRKLKMPVFEGDEAAAWVYRIERYFAVNGLTEEEKLLAADRAKVAAMLDWPTPKTLRELRGFLGLTGYYRKFVKGYGAIAWPLTDQLKKDNFLWGEAANEAFEALKRAMASVPVLALPDFTKTFVVETDASGYGIGAVLMQNQRPIAYFSQVLTTRGRLKSVYERELMAIVLAVQKWRPYLLGRRFIVRTDQRSLKYLLEQRLVTEDHQRWLSKLLGYDFEIQYRPGLENKAADALSRRAGSPQIAALSIPQVLDWTALEEELQTDMELGEIRDSLQKGENRFPGYDIKDHRLCYQGRLVIPRTSALIPRLLLEFHGSAIGGHSGALKTYKRIAAELYWVGMKKDVERFVASCDVCQRNKYLAMSPAGLLQPLPLPKKVWEGVSMDFIEGLPRSEGYTVILVVVDRLSKYAHFIPLRHPYTASSVADVFIREVVRLHGTPESIVSDRDKVFLSQFWKELFRLQGTTLKRSSAYHPQTDGQSEVVNRCVETYLRCFVSDAPRQWARWLPWAEYWYNTSFHTASQTTPFRVLYGRDPPKLVHYEPSSTAVSQVEQYLVDRDSTIEVLKGHLEKAQQKMKGWADGHRRDIRFEVGDWVYLKLRPYRQKSLARRRNEKLSARYFGPFEVVERIGEVAYRLALPSTSSIHPVFHISLLRKAIGNHVSSPTLPPTLTADMEVRMEPAELCGVRQGTSVAQADLEVLIKWKDMPDYEATWEPYSLISQQFPDFHLEDKVSRWGGSIVRPPIIRTYVRRRA